MACLSLLLPFLAGCINSMIFHPPQPPSYRNSDQTITLTAADGARITAVHLVNAKAKHTILFSHGNAADLGHMMPVFREYVRCPVLVIHGTADQVVPLWHGKKVYACARKPKSHWWVSGAGHNNLKRVAGTAYWQVLRTFADHYCG